MSRATQPLTAATIGATRAFYTGLAHGCDSDVEQIEVALAHLAELQLDEQTLDGFQSAQEDAQRAAARCRRLLAVLDARHGQLEEAVNATPDAAKTEFYQTGTSPAGAAVGPTHDAAGGPPAGLGNALDIPDGPDGTRTVASDFVGNQVGAAYAVETDPSYPDDPGVLFTVGSRVEAVMQISPPPGGRVPLDREENLAALAGDEVAALGRRLAAAAKAAQAGLAYGPKTVSGADVGDIEVEAVDGQVRITVLPYGIDEPYDEPFAPQPLTEIDGDDGVRPPTAEELDEYLADERADYDREVAAYDAARYARRHRLTAYLTPAQARQLRGGLIAGVRAAVHA
ncbi:MAG TPA: hypothetical protein VJT31_36055 [Rugosimonospora sp.]|nr:hypothetical protein [Rugosimonospora sp.]